MNLVYHKDFIKDFKKLPKKIKEKFKERQVLFEEDEFNPVLNNHALKGKWMGYRSMNVTGDVRAIFKRDSENALFVAIDSHSNLYG